MALFTQAEEAETPGAAPEYYAVCGTFGFIFVSAYWAQLLFRELQRTFPPRWVRLQDLSGSEVVLPLKAIHLIVQSTPEQRAFDRNMRKQLEGETNEWS